MAFPALLSFISAGHGTNDECAIYLGFRVVGTMVRSMESVQTPLTIELWVIVDPASILSSLESRPVGVSENGEDNIVDFEMITRDPEWQHIAMCVTIDLSNEHLIRFI